MLMHVHTAVAAAATRVPSAWPIIAVTIHADCIISRQALVSASYEHFCVKKMDTHSEVGEMARARRPRGRESISIASVTGDLRTGSSGEARQTAQSRTESRTDYPWRCLAAGLPPTACDSRAPAPAAAPRLARVWAPGSALEGWGTTHARVWCCLP